MQYLSNRKALSNQIALMRKHRAALAETLGRDGADLPQAEREALEHAILSYTEGADMLEESLAALEAYAGLRRAKG